MLRRTFCPWRLCVRLVKDYEEKTLCLLEVTQSTASLPMIAKLLESGVVLSSWYFASFSTIQYGFSCWIVV